MMSEDMDEDQFAKNAVTTKLFRDTGASKLPSVIEYLKDFMENHPNKFILFGHHKIVLDGLSSFLDSQQVRYIRIDGETAQDIRQDLCNKFQTMPEFRVAVLGITCAGVGLTLHAASVVIFTEVYFPIPFSNVEKRKS